MLQILPQWSQLVSPSQLQLSQSQQQNLDSVQGNWKGWLSIKIATASQNIENAQILGNTASAGPWAQKSNKADKQQTAVVYSFQKHSIL